MSMLEDAAKEVIEADRAFELIYDTSIVMIELERLAGRPISMNAEELSQFEEDFGDKLDPFRNVPDPFGDDPDPF